MTSTRTRPLRQAAVTTTLLTALASPWAAQAALDARASLTVRKLPVGSPTPVLVFQDSVRDMGPNGTVAATGLSPDLLYVTVESGAQARYGVVTSFVHADANHPGDAIYYSNGESSGRFTDQFSVTSPGVAGAGTMQLNATVQAVFDYDPQGSTDTTDFDARGAAYIDLLINNVPRIADRYSTRYYADISENKLARMTVDVLSLNGDYSIIQNDSALAGAGYVVTQHFAIEVPFQFGAAINVDALLSMPGTAQACCSAGDGVDAVTRAWFRWDGITDVRRSDGTPITDFQALGAASGFDYAQAAVVPEPATAAMMLAGVLSLLGVRRRRGR